MKIDINRVAAAAIDAALHEERSRRRRVPGVRTIAAGAALATAARAGQKHLPRLTELRLLEHGLTKLVHMPNLRDITDALRDRLDDFGWAHHDHDVADSAAGDGEQDDADFDDEPSGEAEDDEPEDDDDEPRSDEDDDDDRQGHSDDEPTAEDDAKRQPRDEEDRSDEDDEARPDRSDDDEPPRLSTETPDLVDALSTRGSAPRIMEAVAGDLDPAAQPPESGERTANDQRGQARSGTRRRQSTGGRR